MHSRPTRPAHIHTTIAAIALLGGPGGVVRAQDAGGVQTAADVPQHFCEVDLRLSGMMADVLSNALVLGLHLPEGDVRAFLREAKERAGTGDELLLATAARFNLLEGDLRAQVARFEHVNCDIPGWTPIGHDTDDAGGPVGLGVETPAEAWTFARNVTLHVVLHEMGHALVREFDLPVLGNEETMADAFATHILVMHMPDRAPDVLAARVTSLMIEAREQPMADWTGEHDHDGRRAFQIAALAVAADRERYAHVAAIAGLSPDDIADAADYGSEIHRSWRRILEPYWMPEGHESSEARVRVEPGSPVVAQVCDGLAEEVERALRRFDWHSRVSVDFVDGQGGAAWSRSTRTITVHAGYMHRFLTQGTPVAPE